MFVPLLLVFLAVLSAGVVSYGTNATWAQYPHGIELILWSRRLQWPLVTLCLLLCLLLLGLIVAGRRRAWWLIGLGPVLALFAHRFLTDPAAAYFVVDGPTFVSADDASFLADDDYVVGLHFGDAAYAYPYSVLFHDPVVLQSDHDKRLMLMWSAFANRATASAVTRDVKARDIEVVSTPANALLLYNRGGAQFINALTARTMDGGKPIGFAAPLAPSTMTWKAWRGLNPQTKVMAPTGQTYASAPPRGPILPSYPMPPAILDRPAAAQIVLVGTTQPAALLSEQVGPEPLHVSADGEPAFVFRQRPDLPARAFSSHLKKQDVFTRFHLDSAHHYKGAMFIDSDTDSGWSADGLWVDGLKEIRPEMKGTRLTPLPVQDGLYWGVMKFWYPDLKLAPAAEAQSGSTS